MTCHGFGGGKVTSEKPPLADIKAIAHQIKQLKYMDEDPVESAYAVKPKKDAVGHYDIIFRFRGLGEPPFDGYTHAHLVNDIKAIRINGHKVSQVDLWIIP